MFTTKKAEVISAQIFSRSKCTLQLLEGLEHIYAVLFTYRDPHITPDEIIPLTLMWYKAHKIFL